MAEHQPSTAERIDARMIPSTADHAAWTANCQAIDRVTGTSRYPYIVAWGKFLGFTASTALDYLQKAEAENAPSEAIQKIEDQWLVVSNIRNETNRRLVIDLAGP